MKFLKLKKGLENLNNFTTREYFIATNKKKDFIKQMLTRRLRLDYFESKFQENDKSNDSDTDSNSCSTDFDSDYEE